MEEEVAKRADEDDATSELDHQLAAFLHRFDAGINSVLQGKLGHLPDLDPFKERVQAAALCGFLYEAIPRYAAARIRDRNPAV